MTWWEIGEGSGYQGTNWRCTGASVHFAASGATGSGSSNDEKKNQMEESD
jgi:hypothetical protein